MNCRNGRLLTNTELVEIAVANGADPDDLDNLRATHHNANRWRSDLLSLTASARLEMMHRGDLHLEATAPAEGSWQDSLR